MLLLRTVWIGIPLGLAFASGCSLVGTWSTVEVKPADADFPINSVTFADDGTYCVSRTTGGRTSTSSGTYEWNGMILVLEAEGAPPVRYSAFWGIDGRLNLTQRIDRNSLAAVLERLDDQETGTTH